MRAYPKYSGLMQLKSNLTTKRVWKLPTSTQLDATWHTDSLDMVVLPSTSSSRYHNCCIDGRTSPEYFGYTLVLCLCLKWCNKPFDDLKPGTFGTSSTSVALPHERGLSFGMLSGCVCCNHSNNTSSTGPAFRVFCCHLGCRAYGGDI
jgi:hypothetical protein